MQAQFTRKLDSITHRGRFVVAFSGGIDSTVLLHLLHAYRMAASFPVELAAIHVNHQLHNDSDVWAEHCGRLCNSLDISCEVVSIRIADQKGHSLEALARDARYKVISEYLVSTDCLLLAQHRDDQAETFLLQLMRGAGPAGLSAMPMLSTLGHARVYRPLLGVAQSDLLAYARQHQLNWVDDPSNQELRFDRNFLRHTIRPALERRWPAASATIARAAAHCAEQQSLCELFAVQDLEICKCANDALSIRKLSALEPARIRNAVRHWVALCGMRNPSVVVMERVLNELVFGRPDAKAMVEWSDGQFRRYRDSLYFLKSALFSETNRVRVWNREWDGREPLELPAPGGVLKMVPATGSGLSLRALQTATARVHFRQGGEQLRPFQDGMARSLKNLFQEKGLPPWERCRTPLISIGSELVAVGDWLLAQDYVAAANEPGLQLVWERESLSTGVLL